MINILIIEDNHDNYILCESYIRKVSQLNDKFSDIDVLHAPEYETAWTILKEKTVHIILLDIDLPGKNGLEIASQIRKTNPYKLVPIIFITGTQQRQLEVFKKYHNYEYITKPYSFDVFSSIITALLDAIIDEKLKSDQEENRTIDVEIGRYRAKLKINDILYAETNGRKLTIYMANNRTFRSAMGLDKFINSINSETFIRCHKSFAVNVRHITEIIVSTNRLWELHFGDTGHVCEMSSTYKDKVLSVYNKV